MKFLELDHLWDGMYIKHNSENGQQPMK